MLSAHTLTHSGWCSGWMNRHKYRQEQHRHRHPCCWCNQQSEMFFFYGLTGLLLWTTCMEAAASCERCHCWGFLEGFLGRWGHRETHPEARAPIRKGQGWKTFNSGSEWVTCREEAIVSLWISILFRAQEFWSVCGIYTHGMTYVEWDISLSNTQTEALWQL